MRNFNAAMAIGLAITIGVFLSSCQNFEDFKEIDEVDTEAEYAIPLINTTTSLQDILDEVGDQNDLSGLIIADDGSMKVSYQNEPISQNIKELYEDIPSFPLFLPFNSNEIPFQFIEDISVEKLHMSDGTLSFDLESNHPEDIDVLITIPNLTKNGLVFNVMTELIFTGSAPTQASTSSIPLEDYILDVSDGTLQVYYQAVNGDGVSLPINPITGMAENWDYDYIQGVWARDTFNLSMDTLEIDIFDNWVDGDITFANPRLRITIDNSFGFSTMASIDELKVVTANDEIMHLQSTLFDDPIYLDYPGLMETDVTKQTVLDLNNTNSNIAEVLNAHPKLIIYSLSAIINPDEDPNTSGFMTDESAIGVSLETELPIHGTASGFEIEEPIESDLSGLDDIEWAEFKIITDNGLPVDLGIQLYFTNEAGEKIDSLYTDYENITQSAEINGTGDVISSTEKVSYVEITAERMENIKQSNKLLIGATFSTANEGNTPVKILTTHELNIKVGMKVSLEN